MILNVNYSNLSRSEKISLLQLIWDLARQIEDKERNFAIALSEFVDRFYEDSVVHWPRDSISNALVDLGDKILGETWFSWLYYEGGEQRNKLYIDGTAYEIDSIVDLAEMILPKDGASA